MALPSQVLIHQRHSVGQMEQLLARQQGEADSAAKKAQREGQPNLSMRQILMFPFCQ